MTTDLASSDRPAHPTLTPWRYWAFISYSHRDQRSATWLHRALERYAVPRQLVGTQTAAGTVPKRLRPIFLDQEDLPTSSDLSAQVQDALRASRSLIVVCSPQAAASQWVDQEILFFKRLGREDRIFAMIVDGEPSLAMNPVTGAGEPFPRSLRFRLGIDGQLSAQPVEPLAADHRHPRAAGRRTLLRLVAGLLGLELDTLARRDAVARRWRVARFSTIALVVFGASLGAWYAQHVETQQQATIASLERLASESSKMLRGESAGGEEKALLMALAGHALNPSASAVRSSMGFAAYAVPNLLRVWATGSVVSTIAVSPDGSRIASGGRDGVLRIWDANTGLPVAGPLTGHEGAVLGMAFSHDGLRIVSAGSDGHVRLWDAVLGRPIGTPGQSRHDSVSCVAFNADSSRIVSGGAGTLRQWNGLSGLPVATPIGTPSVHPDDIVESVRFSQSGKAIMSMTLTNKIQAWDANTGRPIGAALRIGVLGRIAVSRDASKIAFAEPNGNLTLWRSTRHGGENSTKTMENGAAPSASIAFDADASRILVGAPDGTLRLWNVASGRLTHVMGVERSEPAKGLSFIARSSRAVSFGEDGNLRLWQIPDAPPGDRRPSPDDFISMAFNADRSRVALGDEDGRLVLKQAPGGETVGVRIKGHANAINNVAFMPDGSTIVSAGDDETLRRWSVGKNLSPVGLPLVAHAGRVWSVAISVDGARVVSGHHDGTLHLWDTRSSTPIGAPLVGHARRVWCLAFSPDGSMIASGDLRGVLRRWDAHSGMAIGDPIQAHPHAVTSLAFSPDGRNVWTGGDDGALRQWDGRSGQLLHELTEGHEQSVNSLAISRDGATIVSAGFRGSIRVWDAQTGARLGAPANGPGPEVRIVAFNADDSQILAGRGTGELEAWPAPRAWADVLCAKLTRNMSHDEWRAWVSPSLPYRTQCPALRTPA